MKEIEFTTSYKGPTEVLEMEIDSRLKLIKGLLEAFPSSVPRDLVSFLKQHLIPFANLKLIYYFIIPSLQRDTPKSIGCYLEKQRKRPYRFSLSQKKLSCFVRLPIIDVRLLRQPAFILAMRNRVLPFFKKCERRKVMGINF
ncbi:putative p21-activated kinase 3 [Trypanosoma cruzi]|nr:putative p21-activated kinase 3 [Trypanosoma cruzi]